MAFDIGLPIGLAYRHDFGRDMTNASQLAQFRRQAKIDAEVKAKLYADEMETFQVRNPYDAKEYDTIVEKVQNDLAKFLSTNPNFRTDNLLMLEYNKIKRGLRDNDPIRRDLSFQEQKKLLSAYVAKASPEDQHAQLQVKQMENYINTGRTDGRDAKKFGAQEFFFVAPSEAINLPEVYQKAGSAFGDLDYTEFASGAVKATPNKESLMSAALQTYQQYKSAIDDDWNKLGETGQKGYKSIIDYTAAQIRPNISAPYQRGYKETAGGADGRGGISILSDPWRDFYDTPSGKITDNLSSLIVNKGPEGSINIGEEAFVVYMDPKTGKEGSIRLELPNKFYKGMSTNVYQNLDAQGKPSHGATQKYLQYNVEIPKEDISHHTGTLIDEGLIDNKNWGPGNPFVTDYGDLGESKQPRILSETEDGGAYNMVLYGPIDDNEETANKWNQNMLGEKDAVYRIGDMGRDIQVQELLQYYSPEDILGSVNTLMSKGNITKAQAIQKLFNVHQNAKRK